MDYPECEAIYKVMKSHLTMIDGVLYSAKRAKQIGRPYHAPSGFQRGPLEDVEEALDILTTKCEWTLHAQPRVMLGDIYNDYGDMLE